MTDKKTNEEIAREIMSDLLEESLNYNRECGCGFDEEIGEGYQGGTCLEHKAMQDIESALDAKDEYIRLLKKEAEAWRNGCMSAHNKTLARIDYEKEQQ